MIVNAVIYTFAPEDADVAESILHELRDLTRAEKGCLRFDVARSIDSPNVFALWEEYRDESALEVHFATEHFDRLGRNGVRRLAKERIGHKSRPID